MEESAVAREQSEAKQRFLIREEREAINLRERMIGLRSRMRGVLASTMPARPERIRHRHRSWKNPTPPAQRARERANWRRSKVGRAELRRRRKAPFQTKTSEEIRAAIARKKSDQANRRLLARLEGGEVVVHSPFGAVTAV